MSLIPLHDILPMLMCKIFSGGLIKFTQVSVPTQFRIGLGRTCCDTVVIKHFTKTTVGFAVVWCEGVTQQVWKVYMVHTWYAHHNKNNIVVAMTTHMRSPQVLLPCSYKHHETTNMMPMVYMVQKQPGCYNNTWVAKETMAIFLFQILSMLHAHHVPECVHKSRQFHTLQLYICRVWFTWRSPTEP